MISQFDVFEDAVTDMATIRGSALDAFVTNLTHERQRIIAALDFLFTGF